MSRVVGNGLEKNQWSKMANESTTNEPAVRKTGTWLAVSGLLGLIFFSLYSLMGANPMVSAEIYLNQAFPLTIVPGILLGAAAFGFWTEKPWSRHVAIAFLILTGAMVLLPVFSTKVGFPQSSVIMIVLFILGLTFWYLYQEESVNSYYQRIGGEDLSAVTESKLIYLFLVVPYLNLLVITKGVANLLEDMSARLKTSAGGRGGKKMVTSILYFLFVGVLVVYLVGLSFSYLALPITIKPDMTLGEKLWQLFVWPFYNFLVLPPE